MNDPEPIDSMVEADMANGEPHALDESVDALPHPGTRAVDFRVGTASGARRVTLVGDFNDWSTDRHPMQPDGDGFRLTVHLPLGARIRYKLLVDGTRWDNDPNAADFEPNEHGGYDSVMVV